MITPAARRIELNLTQAELGRRLGVLQCTIAAWERRRRKPGVLALGRWARALKVGVDELLRWLETWCEWCGDAKGAWYADRHMYLCDNCEVETRPGWAGARGGNG